MALRRNVIVFFFIVVILSPGVLFFVVGRKSERKARLLWQGRGAIIVHVCMIHGSGSRMCPTNSQGAPSKREESDSVGTNVFWLYRSEGFVVQLSFGRITAVERDTR